mmetsp:Transcript_3835/g.12131  ORF Transcript_3835/g.12131 Transcript_3835/m.12131 type:complete len:261 (+) Transcript_3835:1701-2483(+)
MCVNRDKHTNRRKFHVRQRRQATVGRCHRESGRPSAHVGSSRRSERSRPVSAPRSAVGVRVAHHGVRHVARVGRHLAHAVHAVAARGRAVQVHALLVRLAVGDGQVAVVRRRLGRVVHAVRPGDVVVRVLALQRIHAGLQLVQARQRIERALTHLGDDVVDLDAEVHRLGLIRRRQRGSEVARRARRRHGEGELALERGVPRIREADGAGDVAVVAGHLLGQAHLVHINHPGTRHERHMQIRGPVRGDHGLHTRTPLGAR